jgi:hypothetical protein
VVPVVIDRVRQHLARHGEWWWVPVCYGLVVAWTYRGLWHQHGAATGFGWDVIDTHGPDLDFMARELREGRFSLWDPYDKGGYAVYADPVVARYYPFGWPFTAWGAAFGVSWWLIQIEFLAHHVAMAACMHGFLRSRGLPVRAAMIGGIGLVVSAPLLVHKGSNILWPLVWVPLVWIAIDAAIARPIWRRGVAVAAAFTLCATAGSPPGLFYAGLLIAPYGVWRVATVRPAWRPLIRCAVVAVVVAGLVVAVTVIPAQALVALGSRDRWASGDSFALALSFNWRGVMRGVFAHGTGFPEMYLGAALVLLAACALVQPWRDGGAPQLFALIAAFGLVLVAGATLPVLPWLVHHVPGFALLRIPGRYKLLAAWGIAAGAGYGAAGLGGPRPRVAIIAVAVGLAASSYAVAAYGTGKARPEWWSIAAMAVPCALVAAAAWVPRLRGAATSALVLVVLVDAPTFTHTPALLPASDPRRLHERDDQILGRLDGIRDRFRLYDEFVLGERVGQRRAVRDFRGYPAIDPLTNRRYLDVLDHAKHDPAILTDFNVRWVLQGYHFRFGTTASFAPALAVDSAFVPRGDQIFEARHPAPLVAWYGAVTLVSDPKQVLAVMRAPDQRGNQTGDQSGNRSVDLGHDPSSDLSGTHGGEPVGERRRAVIEPDAVVQDPTVLRLAFAAPGSVDGALVSYAPDAIAFTIDAPRDGIVVLNEIAFPGWTVEVDGSPGTPVVANYLLRAVTVGPGPHRIRWRFAPPHLRALIDGYLLALAIMLVAAAWPRRARACP